MDDTAIREEIFWPKKVGGVSFYLSQYSYEGLVEGVNVTHRKK